MKQNERKAKEAASVLGKLGGKARQAELSYKERVALGRKGAQTRWEGTTKAERVAALQKMLDARWPKRKRQSPGTKTTG